MSGAVVSDDSENWIGADMDAWQLTTAQRAHYLGRIHAYQVAQLYSANDRANRRINVAFGLAIALLALAVVAAWTLP